jgi:tetratricopeptide (TPR) repeat protein
MGNGDKEMLDNAIASYEEALKINSADVSVRITLATLLQDTGQEGDLEAALDHYEQALTAHPQKERSEHAPAVFGALATLHGERGDIKMAAQIYRRATKAVPENANYHFNLATMLAMGGEWNSAIKAYKAAIKLDAQNVEAHEDLIAALQEVRNAAGLEKAIKHRDDVVRAQAKSKGEDKVEPKQVGTAAPPTAKATVITVRKRKRKGKGGQ